jgi:hypothetical protein
LVIGLSSFGLAFLVFLSDPTMLSSLGIAGHQRSPLTTTKNRMLASRLAKVYCLEIDVKIPKQEQMVNGICGKQQGKTVGFA